METPLDVVSEQCRQGLSLPNAIDELASGSHAGAGEIDSECTAAARIWIVSQVGVPQDAGCGGVRQTRRMDVAAVGLALSCRLDILDPTVRTDGDAGRRGLPQRAAPALNQCCNPRVETVGCEIERFGDQQAALLERRRLQILERALQLGEAGARL